MQVSFEKDGVARIGFNHMTGVQDLPEEQRVLPVGSAIGHYLAKDAWFRIVEVGYSVILFSEHAYVNRILNKKTSEANYSGLPPELQGEVLQRAGRKGKLTDLQRPVSEFAIFECTVQLLRPSTALSGETEDGWVALLATHAPGQIQKIPLVIDLKKQILALQHLAFYAPLTEAPYDAQDVLGYLTIKYLTYVSLPLVMELLDNSFDSCRALKTVHAPAVTKIGTSAFAGDNTLQEAGDLSKSDGFKAVCFPLVKEIHHETFVNCEKLTRIDLPLAESVSDSAFDGCEQLAELALPAMHEITHFNYQSGTVEEGDLAALVKPLQSCLRTIHIDLIKEIPPETFANFALLEEAHCKSGKEAAEIDSFCSSQAPARIAVDSSDSALLAWQLV